MGSETMENCLDENTRAFYRHVLITLNDEKVPYLVGGAYALAGYTSIVRHTKDLDLFLEQSVCERAMSVLTQLGYRCEMTDEHWLAKAFSPEDAFVDLIFASGNEVSTVDAEWFEHAAEAKVLDVPVKLCPPEETIWSKAFIMERERYDGADVAHYILVCGERFDWERMLRRFGEHWRVLYSHLILFGFIYPDRREIIPQWVMKELTSRLSGELERSATASETNLCRGTLLSRKFFNIDIGPWGYRDVREGRGRAA